MNLKDLHIFRVWDKDKKEYLKNPYSIFSLENAMEIDIELCTKQTIHNIPNQDINTPIYENDIVRFEILDSVMDYIDYQVIHEDNIFFLKALDCDYLNLCGKDLEYAIKRYFEIMSIVGTIHERDIARLCQI